MRDKKILLVDDSEPAIVVFLPLLMTEFKGGVLSICHQDESATALAAEILARRPDFLLLDYNLARGVKGSEVARLLVDRGFAGRIVGFSTVDSSDRFRAAGVADFVLKEVNHPERSIEELKQVII